MIELKQLPCNLRYVFLDENSPLPVILAAYFDIEQVQTSVKVLKRFKITINWTILT